MAQDTIADALNMIKNAKKAGKSGVSIKRVSNLLIEILKIMKQKGAIKKYKINSKENEVEITILDLIECKAIKPRFTTTKSMLEKYVRRYLPARNIGTIIISTSKGLMSHEDALEKGLGGSLIAYFY
ncbi:30S ribosomal protein S8 [Candidatus Pacearchaeota archaeon]|nr:30S ribosomal protein S8 [Candidatus Pacearchaeota archaeon]